ncbi:MAG: dihydrofolate reductase [Bdellovibrionales bacterium]|nr:dihydrofolate reductase [Bdellovibrionales bacterium]
MPLRVCAIAAIDQDRAIGRDGDIPWHYPEDMKHFARLTSGHAVLMGRKTYDSLPPRYKPLPDRRNFVISRTPENLAGEPIEAYADALDVIKGARNGELALSSDMLWIVGGEQIYRATLAQWDEVYLTRINKSYGGDTFFPEFESEFRLESAQEMGELNFEHWVR